MQEACCNTDVRNSWWKHKEAKQYLTKVNVLSYIFSLFSIHDLKKLSISSISISFCTSKKGGISEKSIERGFNPDWTLPRCWLPAFSNLTHLSHFPPSLITNWCQRGSCSTTRCSISTTPFHTKCDAVPTTSTPTLLKLSAFIVIAFLQICVYCLYWLLHVKTKELEVLVSIKGCEKR